MSWRTVVAVMAGALTAMGVVGTLAYQYGTVLGDGVTTNRWRMLGFALGAALAAFIVCWLVMTLLKMTKFAGVAAEIISIAGAVLAAASIIVGVWYVPYLMAAPVAQRIIEDQSLRENLDKELASELQFSYQPDDVHAALVRILKVGETWHNVLYGRQVEPLSLSVLPFFRSLGMVPYGAEIEYQLQQRGWTPLAKAARPIRCAPEDKADADRLNVVKSKIVEVARDMRKHQTTTQPVEVDWIGRWSEQFEKQAELIIVEHAPKPKPEPTEIVALRGLVSRLTTHAIKLKPFKKEDVKSKDAKWQKVSESAKTDTLPDWEIVPDALTAALDVIETKAEAHLVGYEMDRLDGFVANYAYHAKHGEWWQDPYLKPSFIALESAASGNRKWADKVSTNPFYGEVKTKAQSLAKSLQKTLEDDEPSNGPAPEVKIPPPSDKASWTSEQIWRTINDYYGMDEWQDVKIKVGEKRDQQLPIVQVIWNHFNADFNIGNPPRVSVDNKWSREGATKVANAIVTKYVKVYAADLAEEWHAKVTEVRNARPTRAGEVYPQAGKIRALFTGDNYWKGRLTELKQILDAIGFDHYYKDADGKKSHVDIGPAPEKKDFASAPDVGRQNVAVEKVGQMVDEFVDRLKDVAKTDQDVSDAILGKAGDWYGIFTASATPGRGLNPITILIKIRAGIPATPPENPRRPDGKIDWTPKNPKDPNPKDPKDPKTKRIGPLPQLGGESFNALLTARTPRPEDSIQPAPAVAPSTAAGNPGKLKGDDDDDVRLP